MTGTAAPRGRLPLHPRPLPYEALSSWVGRLAGAYDMESHAFLRAAFGADPPPNDRELDIGVLPKGLMAALAERTGVSRRRVWTMTLAVAMPKVTGIHMPLPGLFNSHAGRFGWFLPQAGQVRAYREPAWPWFPWLSRDLMDGLHRGCLGCLRSDAVPSMRLYWRLSWMASCPLHGRMLLPVVRRPWTDRDLRSSEPQDVAPDLLALDRITLSAVTGGPAVLPQDGELVPAATWLQALRVLLGELIDPKAWLRPEIHAKVASAWRRAGRKQQDRKLCQSKRFETLQLERRNLLLQVAGREVRHRAERRTTGKNETTLLATVMRWHTDL